MLGAPPLLERQVDWQQEVKRRGGLALQLALAPLVLQLALALVLALQLALAPLAR